MLAAGLWPANFHRAPSDSQLSGRSLAGVELLSPPNSWGHIIIIIIRASRLCCCCCCDGYSANQPTKRLWTLDTCTKRAFSTWSLRFLLLYGPIAINWPLVNDQVLWSPERVLLLLLLLLLLSVLSVVELEFAISTTKQWVTVSTCETETRLEFQYNRAANSNDRKWGSKRPNSHSFITII